MNASSSSRRGSKPSSRRTATTTSRRAPAKAPTKAPGSSPGGAKKPPAKAKGPAFVSRPEGVRLQKVLAQAGISSRRKAEELILAGLVRVNGKPVTELGVRVDPERDKILCGGKPVTLEPPIYLVMNKPENVVCSAEGTIDDRGRSTVLSLLTGITQRVYPVGRLDFRTRGVLLLTNDGDFASAVASPKSGVLKTYHVKFRGRLSPTSLQQLRDGVTLEDGTVTRPAEQVEIVRLTTTNTWVQLAITQGLNRQVRRMGEAIGHDVVKLIRVAIGPINAVGLDEGQFRYLAPSEVGQLRHAKQIAVADKQGVRQIRKAPVTQDDE